MNLFGTNLLEPILEDDLLTQLRLRFILILAAVIAVLAGVGLVTQLVVSLDLRFGNIMVLAAIAISGFIIWLARSRYLHLSTLLLLLLLLAGVVFAPGNVALLLGVVALATAAVLGTWPLYIIANGLVFLREASYMIQIPAVVDTTLAPELINAITNVFILITVSFTTRYFIYTTDRAMEKDRRNSQLLAGVAEIGRSITGLLEVDEIFNRSVNAIQKHLDYYHVQIFVIDDNRDYAVLKASTGAAGEELLSRNHRLAVGSNSVVGRASGDGIAVMAVNTSTDKVHRYNDLLPDTRSELAIPIRDGNNVVGVLDVQSPKPEAFQKEDLQALQSLTNILETSIKNARLFEEQNRSVREQQRLFLESESNLREIRRLNQQLTKSGWVEYVNRSHTVTGVTLKNNEFHNIADWNDALAQASYYRRAVVTAGNGEPGSVAVPLLLRGEVIGAIEVEPGEDIQQNEVLEMVEAVAERLAVSLENARLFEESQASALQEQQINEMSARYQQIADVNELLRVTLTELSETLGAQRGSIRLGVLEEEAS